MPEWHGVASLTPPKGDVARLNYDQSRQMRQVPSKVLLWDSIFKVSKSLRGFFWIIG
jgi:hypothetical protein